jgi:hypothetical protein
VIEAERNASRSFLEQMLVQEKDKAFLIHFDREVELLQDLTSSREKLQAALDLLKTPSDRERSNDPNVSRSLIKRVKGNPSPHNHTTTNTPCVDNFSNPAFTRVSNDSHHPAC